MATDAIIKNKIRTVADYPQKGIMYRDITTLLKDQNGFTLMVDELKNHCVENNTQYDIIAGIEARGFIIGSALAHALSSGFVPIRKPGKLPALTIAQEYTLEYGSDTLEMHTDAIEKGMRVLLVDDLLATGGTMQAGADLIQTMGGIVTEVLCVIDLPDLGGSTRLKENGINVFSLTSYQGT